MSWTAPVAGIAVYISAHPVVRVTDLTEALENAVERFSSLVLVVEIVLLSVSITTNSGISRSAVVAE